MKLRSSLLVVLALTAALGACEERSPEPSFAQEAQPDEIDPLAEALMGLAKRQVAQHYPGAETILAEQSWGEIGDNKHVCGAYTAVTAKRRSDGLFISKSNGTLILKSRDDARWVTHCEEVELVPGSLNRLAAEAEISALSASGLKP